MLVIAIAALLGGYEGFYRNRIANTTMGIVTMIASYIKKCLISFVDEFLSIMKLGTEAPRVIDRRVARIPVNVTILTLSLLNQFRATLLGVLRMNMLPMAASIEPIKQYTDCPTSNNSLSQTPEIMKIVPITKDSLMPYLLMNQLQGNAKMGCAIVKSSAFIVT